MNSDLRIGVLSLHNSKETKAILNAVSELGHQPVWIREENAVVSVEEGAVSFEPEVDVVINRLLLSNVDRPSERLGLVRVFEDSLPVLNTSTEVLTSLHKYSAITKLASSGLPVPDSLMAFGKSEFEKGLERITRRNESAVYKTAIGTHGDNAWKVEMDAETSLLPKIHDRRVFLQEFMDSTTSDSTVSSSNPSESTDMTPLSTSWSTEECSSDGGTRVEGNKTATTTQTSPSSENLEGPKPDSRSQASDLRVYVVGGKVIGAMKRKAPEGDWRTNFSRGGSVDEVSVSGEIENLSLKAANAVGLDYAGVDLIWDDGWYILEVNPTAGFKGFFKATGTSPAPYIAALGIEEAGGEVDEEVVEELATELDDSVPECKPEPDYEEESSRGENELGYTQKLTVRGSNDEREVVAKSDTGAARTSIDTELAASIGASINDTSKVRTGGSKSSKTRPVVDVVLKLGDNWHSVSASVEDRSHMDYDVLLGRDVLEGYRINVRKRVDEE